jgi:hypothetical protein
MKNIFKRRKKHSINDFLEKVKKIGDGEYCSVTIEMSCRKNGDIETEFGCYVHGYLYHKSNNLDDCLDNLKAEIQASPTSKEPIIEYDTEGNKDDNSK